MTEEASVPALLDDIQDLLTTNENAEVAAVMGSAFGFIGRIQFQSASSKLCKSGKVPVNSFCFIKSGDEAIVLGQKVDILPLAVRPCAIDTSNSEKPIFCYHPNVDENGAFTGLFKDIADRSATQNSGCLYGPEYLIWIPELKEFGTFLWSSMTMRNDAYTMYALRGKPALLTSHVIKNNKYGDYYSPITKPTETVFTDLPTRAQVQEELAKFTAAKDTQVDVVDAEEAESTSREQ